MANYKRRHRRGNSARWYENPHKVRSGPHWWRLRGGDLRRLGGRQTRIGRHDVDWAFRDEGT